MSTPQTINGLMRHLRNDCGIQISGSMQKKQLISYGYYHGYKGYCIPRTPTDGFAEQNGRDAERADFLTLIYNI